MIDERKNVKKNLSASTASTVGPIPYNIPNKQDAPALEAIHSTITPPDQTHVNPTIYCIAKCPLYVMPLTVTYLFGYKQEVYPFKITANI